MSPRSFVSLRHESRRDPRSRSRLQSGQSIVREGAECPVIKVYMRYIITMIFIFRVRAVPTGRLLGYGVSCYRSPVTATQ